LVSPAFGPPGTAITLTGTGFAAGTQVGCPELAPTVVAGSTSLTAAIPLDVMGPAGGTVTVYVFAVNADGGQSAGLPFNVVLPADRLQTYTTIEAVCGEVVGFKRGGQITDAIILGWMRTTAQSVNGAMLKRGLPLDPALWQQPAGNASPAPAGVLDMINRLGAAARLASAMGAQFSTAETGLSKNLQGEYFRELTALKNGDYDKLFLPAAATVDSGPQLAVGDVSNPDTGDADQAFSKDQVF
jgi:hypothetical protein